MIGNKIAIFDAFSGASGDMCLGSLLDIGYPLSELESIIEKLGLNGCSVEQSQVLSHGIVATRIEIKVDERAQPHRHLSHIQQIINNANLPAVVKERALTVFTRLADAEAKVHQTTREKVHFHEVGAADALIDIVGTCAALHYLEIEEVFFTPLPLGSGFVQSAHGTLPVPAPATAELVRGVPVIVGQGEGEVLTPTGAALLTTLGKPLLGPRPTMRVDSLGYGAGSRIGRDRPNYLRLLIGFAEHSAFAETEAQSLMIHPTNSKNGRIVPIDFCHPLNQAQGDQRLIPYLPELMGKREEVYVIEATIDDMNPELFSYLLPKLLEKGALDTYVANVLMKKGRPGYLLTVLCTENLLPLISSLIFSETTTLGIRYRQESRFILARQIKTVETQYGPIRVKIGLSGGQIINMAPEYDDCQRIANEQSVPIKWVYQEAVIAASRLEESQADHA